MLTDTQTTLMDFVNVVSGQKEVGLVIAKEAVELRDFAHELDHAGLQRSETVFDLFGTPKTYVVIRNDMAKDIYDFAVQYPTGQVELFDRANMQSKVVAPDYKNRVVIVLTTKEHLAALEAKGFAIRAAVGPAYQS